jgi:G:T-mismatch repair DNA endonuclease (very short patch repair protein)
MAKICSVDGCKRNVHGRNLCSLHYQRKRKNNTLDELVKQPIRICSVEKCTNKHFGKGFCANHYTYWRKYGNPLQRANPVETSKKISESKKGKPSALKGKRGRYSKDTLKRMSEAKKGKKHSEETKKKRSESLKGRIFSAESKKKMSESRKGKKLSVEHKKNLSKSHMGNQPSVDTKKKMSESRKGTSPWNKGVPHTVEHKKKMSESMSTPEQKQRARELLRQNRHNQTSPTIPESIMMKILTDGGIKYKFNPNVDYLTLENKHRKKEVDFLIKPKKIIEFNGYRHYDNRNFKPDDVVTHHNKPTKCQDIWNEENTVLNQIKKEGYKILVVWDWDLKKDLDKTTKKILKFAKA